MILLGAAVFLNYVDRGAIAVAAPLMKGELGLTATEFGTAVSAFFWIYAPVQLFAGWLCDRFSVYRLMAMGVIVWAASTLADGLCRRVPVAAGAARDARARRKHRLSREARRSSPSMCRPSGAASPMRRCAMGIALGPAVGTLAGGLILAKLGWRAIFIAFGLATLIWLVPWQRVVNCIAGAARGRNASRRCRWASWSAAGRYGR